MIQLLPGIRIKVSKEHSTYGRIKVKTIQLFLGKYRISFSRRGHEVMRSTGHFRFSIPGREGEWRRRAENRNFRGSIFECIIIYIF